jgi:hypothetical protein
MKRTIILLALMVMVPAVAARAGGTPGNPQAYCVHNYAGVAAATLNAALYSVQLQNNIRAYPAWQPGYGRDDYFVVYVANPTTDACPTGGFDVEVMVAGGTKYPNDYPTRAACGGANAFGYHASAPGLTSCHHMNNRVGPFAVVAVDVLGVGSLAYALSHELNEMSTDPNADGYNPPTAPYFHEAPCAGAEVEVADPAGAAYVDPLDFEHSTVANATTPRYWGYSTGETYYDILGEMGLTPQITGPLCP